MNWYKGNIAEAVAKSKAENAIFVVYVEGQDESTQRLSNFINDQRIREKLESEEFVAIKIESDSQAYMQFATIYQVVPVPSIFFIGKSGTPLEVGTGVIASVNELEDKINKVLLASGKSTPSVSSSTSLIDAERKSASSSSTRTSIQESEQTVTDLTTGKEANTNSVTEIKLGEDLQDDHYEVVCEGGVCYKKSKDQKSAPITDKENHTLTKSLDENPTTNIEKEVVEPSKGIEEAEKGAKAKLDETRTKMEEQRKKRIEEEKQLEKDRELRRRREGKEMQNLQQWQHEKELKELKDNIRREKMEEIAARERIRAQIAADRAERAHKFSSIADENVANTSTDAAANNIVSGAATTPDSTRIQFRFANGNTATHVFNCQDTLSKIREYVRVDLLPGTGIKDFTLATTYPKRELEVDHNDQTLADLNLFPSAVILIIGKESLSSPAAIIARSGGLLNIFTTLVMTILSPVFSIFGYFKNIATGRGGRQNGNEDGNNVGANKRANEENGAQHDAAKRRNMDRFGGGTAANSNSANIPSTSADATSEKGETKPYRRYGSSNIHRLTDHKDSDDENATWNGNSTQQQ